MERGAVIVMVAVELGTDAESSAEFTHDARDTVTNVASTHRFGQPCSAPASRAVVTHALQSVATCHILQPASCPRWQLRRPATGASYQ